MRIASENSFSQPLAALYLLEFLRSADRESNPIQLPRAPPLASATRTPVSSVPPPRFRCESSLAYLRRAFMVDFWHFEVRYGDVSDTNRQSIGRRVR